MPEIAARAHTEILPLLAQEVLAEARRKTEQKNRTPDFVAATLGPGLVGGLAAGAVFARSLSWAWGVRFIPINHLAAGMRFRRRFASRVGFPYFLLLVSGGHCQLLAVRSADQFRLYGATRDDAAGEVFDKVGRALGFAWPGGPNLRPSGRFFCCGTRGQAGGIGSPRKAPVLRLATGGTGARNRCHERWYGAGYSFRYLFQDSRPQPYAVGTPCNKPPKDKTCAMPLPVPLKPVS